ncbi:MAG: hypothetical protein A2579_09955 [Lysobacterales bacterium RIFOXYD1_FULL_69_11]|nr:MAG: hypothetical protein A2190_13980 [Xanthomonadales bacterium RIFOXYA1_FULL_69_10]OHE87359.1 MAG: hypothetical protein A2579_09955 [Xanthomonadales bacterium RIFOXYD1_FULL_69_11]
MEPALKQRLIGAAVLVALAVIFLPMLIKGPAPESGVSDVSLDVPARPGDDGMETRELPLLAPGEAPADGALGLPAGQAEDSRLPTVDTTTGGGQSEMMPAPTAGGDYAVSFGSYASTGDAARVVEALRSSQLPGYQERVEGRDGRTIHRVRVGPYASRADAEAARLRAAHVRDDVGSQVVALDAGEPPREPASASKPAAAATTGTVKQEPLAANEPAAKPEPKPAAPKPAPEPEPVAAPAKPASAAPSKPAAADVGFAVQLGAYSNADEAGKLRDRVRGLGFGAFIEQVNTDKGTLTRVLAGPVSSREQAEQLKSQVAARTGITGLVRAHP